ncbi:hypothetical protein EVAR_98472_1 [Eumeta japonica]|uniref:Uncharacterized protein n=1 Tax=Eumeta variegata TaxID=151549 RepID=A0A4C1T2C3_EUMVA|nr:hypothetical protein EVAR_98472_1 [Eumeta japonica]
MRVRRVRRLCAKVVFNCKLISKSNSATTSLRQTRYFGAIEFCRFARALQEGGRGRTPHPPRTRGRGEIPIHKTMPGLRSISARRLSEFRTITILGCRRVASGAPHEYIGIAKPLECILRYRRSSVVPHDGLGLRLSYASPVFDLAPGMHLRGRNTYFGPFGNVNSRWLEASKDVYGSVSEGAPLSSASLMSERRACSPWLTRSQVRSGHRNSGPFDPDECAGGEAGTRLNNFFLDKEGTEPPSIF